MNFDLGGVLSTLIAVAFGSAATLVATISPSNRRVKRLEWLTELRSQVSTPTAQLRLDYAIDELSYQVAEGAKHLGHRPRGRAIWPAVVMLIAGIVLMILGSLRPDAAPKFTLPSGFGLATLGYTIIMVTAVVMPEQVEKKVKKELVKRRDDQLSQPARAKGRAEGDVPAP